MRTVHCLYNLLVIFIVFYEILQFCLNFLKFLERFFDLYFFFFFKDRSIHIFLERNWKYQYYSKLISQNTSKKHTQSHIKIPLKPVTKKKICRLPSHTVILIGGTLRTLKKKKYRYAFSGPCAIKLTHQWNFHKKKRTL